MPNSPDSPQVSVVLVSWNTSECHEHALDSVALGAGPRTFELIVVDNGSADDTLPNLAKRGDVHVVEMGTNTGFTHAANVGAKEARGEFVLFLNPDVVIHPGTLDRLATILETHPEAWGAVPWFLNPDGTRQNFWRRFPGGFVTFFCFTRLGKRLDRLVGQPMMRYRNMLDLPDPPGVVQTIGVGAACFLVRRAEFLEAGAFDERYFNFFQDGEIQRTKWRQGRHVLGVGDAPVTHTMGVTTRKMSSGKLDGEFLYGLRQFLAGAGTRNRLMGEAAIRFDLLLPRRDRSEVRAAALRPLTRS